MGYGRTDDCGWEAKESRYQLEMETICGLLCTGNIKESYKYTDELMLFPYFLSFLPLLLSHPPCLLSSRLLSFALLSLRGNWSWKFQRQAAQTSS